MGTNFFFRTDLCGSCNRYNEHHIGKRSGGWSFGFRAYPHQFMNADHLDWGYDPESPFGFPVLSRADWRKVFTEQPGEIWDEYGRQVEESPLEWLDALVAPDVVQQAKENAMTSVLPWRDAEGFRFESGEFS